MKNNSRTMTLALLTQRIAAPAQYQRDILQYIKDRNEIFSICLQAAPCQACGREGIYRSDDFNLCRLCKPQCAVHLYVEKMRRISATPRSPVFAGNNPVTVYPRVLAASAKYAFGVLLCIKARKRGVACAQQCDICIHRHNCILLRFVNISVEIRVCGKCYKTAANCAAHTKRTLTLIRHILACDDVYLIVAMYMIACG